MQELTVHVSLRSFPLTVRGHYFPGRPGLDYLPNGDPGFPPEESTFEILEVHPYGSSEDIILFFDDLYFRSSSFKDGKPVYTLALEELEDACIEKIKED